MDRSDMPGFIKKAGVTYVWDLTADAYVLVTSTGPTDMASNEGRLPDGQEGGKLTPELGKLKPRQLDRHLTEDLYGTDLDDED